MFPRLALPSLLPVDPALLRLTGALRTSLAAVATGLIAVPVLHAAGQPVITSAPAVLFAMLTMLFLRDRTLAARRVTSVLACGASILGLAAATWLARRPYAAPALLLVLLAGTALLQTRGPRAVVTALSAFIACYVGMFLRLPPAGLAWAVGLMLPVLAVCLLALHLFPDDPAATARRALASVARQARGVLAEATRHRRPGRLERHLLQLNQAAAMAEEHLQLADIPEQDALRARLVNLEIAVTHVVLNAETADAPHDAPRWQTALSELRQATAALGQAPRPHPAARPPAPEAKPPFAWRPAVQAGCAGLAAMLAGVPLSPAHWYWAVIGVAVTFLGPRSTGEVVQKGLFRLAGTFLGASAGLAIATLVHAHPALIVLGMILCVFGWSYFVLYNYIPGIFFLTLLLGLVYAALGQDMPAIVWLRFAETGIGALASFAAAMWLWPLRTSAHVQASARAPIRHLEAVVALSERALESPEVPSPLAALRQADRALQALHVALRPARSWSRLFASDPAADGLPAMLVCVHWVRVLALATAKLRGTTPEQRAALAARLARVRLQLAALAQADQPKAALVPAVFAETGAIPVLSDALDQLDGALALLRARLSRPPREAALGLADCVFPIIGLTSAKYTPGSLSLNYQPTHR